MIQIAGFTPDAVPTTPGALLGCVNCVPSETGMQGAPSPVDAVSGLSALSATCVGAAVLTSTSGTRRTFAGTATRLYEQSSTAWVDVSRGSAYAGTTDTRWMFEQFGNVALATNNVEKIQASASTAFADVASAPIARVVFATDNFVIALDCDHTATGNNPDGWMCSAYQDYSSWTADVSTQATSGRLIGNGGPLTAGLALGPYAVAYKDDAIFLGSYAGPPIVWQWERIPGEIGCVGPDAVCDIGGAHVFVGKDDVWVFDGTRPQSIADGSVKEWLFGRMNYASRGLSTVRFDQKTGRVWIFYPSSGAALDSALVYSVRRRRWGVADMMVEAVLRFTSPGVTWATLPVTAPTWAAMPDVSWSSPLWTVGTESICVFNDAHQLKSLSGISAGGGFTTWDFGDEERVSMCRSSRVRFKQAPDSANAQVLTTMESGEAGMPGVVANYVDSKFDHRQSGRFHRIAYTMTGAFDATGVRATLVQQGQR